MFIDPTTRYFKGTSQCVRKARFLMVASDPDSRDLYGCVRKVAMEQCGHWMMGAARIAGERVGLSGAYGDDGLPMNFEKLTPAQRRAFIKIPDDLAEVFWKGGGHNSAGSEAEAMVEWARKQDWHTKTLAGAVWHAILNKEKTDVK
jgi:hypothetical protein